MGSILTCCETSNKQNPLVYYPPPTPTDFKPVRLRKNLGEILLTNKKHHNSVKLKRANSYLCKDDTVKPLLLQRSMEIIEYDGLNGSVEQKLKQRNRVSFQIEGEQEDKQSRLAEKIQELIAMLPTAKFQQDNAELTQEQHNQLERLLNSKQDQSKVGFENKAFVLVMLRTLAQEAVKILQQGDICDIEEQETTAETPLA
ncbi:hypothetical protein FGO68_gene12952 [Halteria grandinella]|uniref:Uncharacterized protein n=1 Tax=Halteria grandinella TaxID=5974 RepID=A0A8J8NJ41_HALGN|nr:hypothetical protein FGO68_gene12952 [Halteria grandinella]